MLQEINLEDASTMDPEAKLTEFQVNLLAMSERTGRRNLFIIIQQYHFRTNTFIGTSELMG